MHPTLFHDLALPSKIWVPGQWFQTVSLPGTGGICATRRFKTDPEPTDKKWKERVGAIVPAGAAIPAGASVLLLPPASG